RKPPHCSTEVQFEMTEIDAVLHTEEDALKDLGLGESFRNFIRFVIAAIIFVLHQSSGENSVIVLLEFSVRRVAFICSLDEVYRDKKRSFLALSILVSLRYRLGKCPFPSSSRPLTTRMPVFISEMSMSIVFLIPGAILRTNP
ncbi:hypothetical protein V8B97DRAFT_1858260, partial [Scleroderma yunnanense]